MSLLEIYKTGLFDRGFHAVRRLVVYIRLGRRETGDGVPVSTEGTLQILHEGSVDVLFVISKDVLSFLYTFLCGRKRYVSLWPKIEEVQRQ